MNNNIWQTTPIKWDSIKENELCKKSYSILLKWLPYAEKQYQEWDIRKNCGHFFGGSYWYGLETAGTALVYAVIARLGEYDEKITGIPRSQVLKRAVSAIRYLGFTHDTGPDDCVRVQSANPHCSFRKWGGKGDGFFQASQHGVPISQFGLAAWILWDKLDDETRILVQNVLSNYADSWSKEKPRNGTYFDTQCEENGWTALGIAIAAVMFSKHQNAELWRQKAIEWLLCACTTYLDRFNRSNYLGKPLAGGWINSITIHPDYTTENHGFVHPNYLSAGLIFGGHISLFNLLAGQEIVPNPFLHWDDIYEKALKVWTMYDGLITPIQGQDWWYNQQAGTAVVHAYLNIFKKNEDAASLERMALESVAKIQDSNKNGCLYEARGEECRITEFQTAKDMEHQAACGIAKIYLLHCFGGEGKIPTSKEELNLKLKGVYNYPYGNSIIHRTQNSFSCFSWRNCVMALTLPQKGMWTVTAMISSYTGVVKLRDNKQNTESTCILNTEINDEQGNKSNKISNKNSNNSLNFGITNEDVIRNVIDENIIPREDGFAVTARIERGRRELLQDVSFVALPDGNTVYIEKFTAAEDCMVEEMKTGTIGIRNEHYGYMPNVAKGYRNVYLEGDKIETFEGYYGKDPDRIVEWQNVSYINIDNEIGYIIFNNNSVEYVNKHQYPKWKGIEDILTLNKCREPFSLSKGSSLEPFILISLPNCTYKETAELAKNVTVLNVDDHNVSMLIFNNFLIYCNREYSNISAAGYIDLSTNSSINNNSNSIYLFKGHNRIEKNKYIWNGDISKRESGWHQSGFVLHDLKNTDISDISLDIDIAANNRAVFCNSSDKEISFKVEAVCSGVIYDIVLKPQQYRICT
ncbi:MAG: hypothetical protein HPY74_05165 [Firmicutes bacterium]|nr:hypothetical protein [Bacillota bacterium]